eukprot:2378474-Karenia_brevis.AAC.1
MLTMYMTRIAERKKDIIGLKSLAQRKETLNKLIETNLTRAKSASKNIDVWTRLQTEWLGKVDSLKQELAE